MVHKHSLSNWIPRLSCVVLCLTLLTTYWSAGLFARYTSSDASKDSGRVAAFVFDVTDTTNHILTLSEITQPGDSETYTFTVSNTRNNNIISEVAETFQLTLELDGSLPLECSLTGADITHLTHTGAFNGNTHIFSASVTESTNYTLTVTWPDDDENKDITFSRAGLAHLLLSVSAQQAD